MSSLGALQQKAAELRKALAKVDALTGKQSERERDKERKRRDRKAESILHIPRCADRIRREKLEADAPAWLRWYFDECDYYTEAVFWYDFTAQQLHFIRAIDRAIKEGGDQSITGSRGEGKTTIARRMLLKSALDGTSSFSVLFSATGSHAEDSLQAIQHDIEFNDRLLADYPEVCFPVRELENTPNRAHYQRANGERHDNGEPYEAAQLRYSWCGQQVRFPNVPGAPGATAIIATRGLDSQIVGLNKLGKRPKIAVIDDPDTDETIYSELQATKLKARIDRSIAGLGSQQRPVARVGLWTVRTRISVAWHYSNLDTAPSWRPQRFRFLVKPPTHLELWEEYILKVKDDWRSGTNHAEQMYLARRAEMDEGAEVANPNRHSAGEHSALQHYYNLVARYGPEAVATEYDNDPPEDSNLSTSGLTAHLVESRVSGLDHRELPKGCVALTAFMDLGENVCHWAVTAWTDNCIGYIVDYGRKDVFGVEREGRTAIKPTLDHALLRTMKEWRTELLGTRYADCDGNSRQVDLAFVDAGSGEHDAAVSAFCREYGPPFHPTKGFGETNFRAIKPGPDRQVFDNAIRTKQIKPPWSGLWLFDLNADHWKKFVHQRFLTESFDADHQRNPGSLALYACGPETQLKKDRREFCHQIVAEIWTEQYVPGKGLKVGWKSRGKNNHWLDAVAGCCAAATVQGVLVVNQIKQEQTKKPAVISMGRPNQARW